MSASSITSERYTIHEPVGEGGYGEVFRAYDTQLRRWVAVKALPLDAGRSLAEQRQELEALVRLRHPGIVAVYDVEVQAEYLLVILEMVDGHDLEHELKRGPMMLEDFKQLAQQVLEAVLAAHAAHLLHRDLKPQNIMLQRKPGGGLEAKLIDFGIARQGLQARRQTESLEGTVAGSVRYMAPEQLQRDPCDARTDLYSLGCVFYEVLCARPAFDGTIADIIEKHLSHEVTPLDRHARHLPQWLTYWVMRLMSRDPADRPPTSQVALEEFRAWQNLPPQPASTSHVWLPPAVQYAYPMPAYVPAQPYIAAPLPVAAPAPRQLPKQPTHRVQHATPAPATSSRRVYLYLGAAALVLLAVFFILRGNPAATGTVSVSSGEGPALDFPLNIHPDFKPRPSGDPMELILDQDGRDWSPLSEGWTLLPTGILQTKPFTGKTLRHPGTITDGIITIEWMFMQPGGESGILFRSEGEKHYIAKLSLNEAGVLSAISPDGSTRDLLGKANLLIQPPSLKAGEWHQTRILLRGARIEIQVDGAAITDYYDKDRPLRSLTGSHGILWTSSPLLVRRFSVQLWK